MAVHVRPAPLCVQPKAGHPPTALRYCSVGYHDHDRLHPLYHLLGQHLRWIVKKWMRRWSLCRRLNRNLGIRQPRRIIPKMKAKCRIRRCRLKPIIVGVLLLGRIRCRKSLPLGQIYLDRHHWDMSESRCRTHSLFIVFSQIFIHWHTYTIYLPRATYRINPDFKLAYISRGSE